jgi:haloalkane dehalogenase
MRVLRTPEERFEGLADYPFAPNYVDIDLGEGATARQHYLDEGPRAGPLALLLHGEPSWSYLYRRMIPPLTAAGMRVVAPDLIGFGKSDKPDDIDFFTYDRHVSWLEQFLDRLSLTDIHLFCQDWGGLLGLRIVATRPGLFAGVVASNTMLPVGKTSDAFKAWQDFARNSPEFPIGNVLQGASVRDLSAEEVAAYDAPFPDESFKAAARAFPLLVPTSEGEPSAVRNRELWDKLAEFERPFLTLFGDSDPVTGGGEKILQGRIAGAHGQPHEILPKTGHFSQEDQPERLARGLLSIAGLA